MNELYDKEITSIKLLLKKGGDQVTESPEQN